MASSLQKSRFFCGTSNIVLPVPNKAHFPDDFRDKSRLQYYASLFNSLEVNSSFYKIPMERTVARWAAEVPEDFRFTFKLWKGITHGRELTYTTEDIDRFVQVVNHTGQKKGCILVQFPASIRFSRFAAVCTLLGHIAARALPVAWRIAVEFRDKSWYREEVFGFLEDHQLGLVQHDMPASSIFFPDLVSDFTFLRFHGPMGDYKGTYSRALLEEYAEYIREWLTEGKTVFAYYNNTIGDTVHNALALQQLLHRS